MHVSQGSNSFFKHSRLILVTTGSPLEASNILALSWQKGTHLDHFEWEVGPIKIRRRLLTTGCHQTFWSADNRLSLAKCLVTTGCHQQKVCWQPAVYFSITMCTLFNNMRHLMIYSAINCFSIHMYEYRDFYTKKYEPQSVKTSLNDEILKI